MAGQYDGYTPIPAEDLPAKYAGCFKLLDLTFTPPNDFDRVMTITGKTLQLVTDGDDGDARRNKQLVIHAGYQKAIWELREGHLRYCPSQQRLWRRDPDVSDHEGDRLLLNSWHPVKSIEDEYGIGNGPNDRSRNSAMSRTILREAKRSQWFQQVERGVCIDPCVWIRRDGRVLCLRGETDMAVTQTFDPRNMGNKAIQDAVRICKWLTTSDESCMNLLRMFATPWLEPFKQLTFILSGHGGDGKTLLLVNAIQGVLGELKSFPAFSINRYCAPSGFSLAAESMNDAMEGKAFAYDDEAGEVTDDMLPALRALSTGSRVQARVTGGKYRMVRPTATIVLLTNMPFADSPEPSDQRRFVKIEMHPSKGRSYDQYHAIESFIREHPAAFYAASCRLWEKSDEPELVNLSPARAISDEMFWIINEIMTNEEKYGQPIALRDGYRDEFHKPVPRDAMLLLGLSNSTTTVLGGGQKRVVRVTDMPRFDVYRAAIANESDDDSTSQTEDPHAKALSMPGPGSLEPLDPPVTPMDGARIVEQACRGEVGFAYCEGKDKGGHFDEKVSLSWKRLNQDDRHHADAGIVQPGWTRYACPPMGRTFVIDCDTNKNDSQGPHGFQLLQAMVGPYGSTMLPATLAVRSPHGLHLWYRVPDGFDPSRLLNAVHPEGIPIDLRVSNKGYVLGPGSKANGGEYLLADLPPADGIPDATPELVRFLESHEYTDKPRSTPQSPAAQAQVAASPIRLSLEQVMADEPPARRGSGRPDMTPIPEGQRNTTLHDWAYGRAANHSDNLAGIESDLYQRGRASGLQGPELATIWKSILRQLGKETR